MSKPRLHGKVALITGAASGIGEETARLFAANGAFVVVADIDDELGQKVVDFIGVNQASFHHCDVRDEKQVEETMNYTIEKHGRLDILFSNAGIIGCLTSSILTLDMSKFDNIMATNVRGMIATIKHAGRVMIERKIRGCLELGVYGIRVNCMSPFGVATPLTCRSLNMEESEAEEIFSSKASLKGEVLKARHIAEAVAFLASDESTYISGQNLVVDGGFMAFKSILCDVSSFSRKLHGKVALITGAASGIGEETVRLFVANGAFVVIADINDKLGQKVVMSIGVDQVLATIKHAGGAMVKQEIRGSIICMGSTTSVLSLKTSLAAYTSSKHAVLGVVRSSCGELGTYGIRVNCVSPHGLATPLTCRSLYMEESEIEEFFSSKASLKGVVLKASHIAEAVMFLASR
ncbi:short-chain dehydrogenase reductase 3b-like isoform X2 [Cucumis melo var. makuwa]|uniref:Short-chain dehydrogenase reductase 3b-like isoform X2 n=1 Tax=Cucumis melo var. makuwa TaxID=1194695 RepID=A0A5D3BR09_CUCMM|nr:short-chain dehydrogenase reductase 3b-like isoform X2 [Cucumis melo var. makuwa]TYK01625.1 short-chain dehydrogenase reductase 3b-like isoform X2 [Cucumis melo var. makuwa]